MIAAADQQIRHNKLTRLKSGAAPRALEICSGSGGLSLGLKTAGFDLTAHIEIDNEAARSYALNFGGDRSADDPWRLPRDMVACSAHDLVTELGLSTSAADSFDLLAAGLPCQAFARIGRSKLRSVAG
ncbi:DNA cytosine methyltransferase, partial [Burkholderia sp. LMG 13014]